MVGLIVKTQRNSTQLNSKTTSVGVIVKTQRNSTQLKATLKQLALELDTVVTCSTPPHPTTTHKLSGQF